MSGGRPVRVLVVEDSAVQRHAIVRALGTGDGIEVCAQAGDVGAALRAVAEHRPDLVTMDLEIPGGPSGGLGGVEAIRRLMVERPLPILVLSVHTPSRTTSPAMEALAAGAIDVLPKEAVTAGDGAELLCRRVKLLARVPMVARRGTEPLSRPVAREGRPVVALAASTGGPGALRQVVAALRGLPAPILVVQHIHPDFVGSFATWLEEMTLMPVAVAADGDPARPGVVHVAPAERHLRLGPGRVLHVDPEPALAANRPSCDVLLSSVAEVAGAAGVGAVLTGMGDDGARGLLDLRQAGGRTFAQDGASAVVDGIPRAARERGGAERVLPLDELGPAILRHVLAAAGASR
jgi:two-component system, chemotaxis family, protein-glutamate methylesterase/glutaminase